MRRAEILYKIEPNRKIAKHYTHSLQKTKTKKNKTQRTFIWQTSDLRRAEILRKFELHAQIAKHYTLYGVSILTKIDSKRVYVGLAMQGVLFKPMYAIAWIGARPNCDLRTRSRENCFITILASQWWTQPRRRLRKACVPNSLSYTQCSGRFEFI